jgi:hypothetical protein
MQPATLTLSAARETGLLRFVLRANQDEDKVINVHAIKTNGKLEVLYEDEICLWPCHGSGG